ncbi:MAG TPA: alpha/beta fold hydrolase [Devosiaceae bacterium]|jgi:aminoacrylate hydrolase|nr:alpha/beta fold hydrolase [Devosiaceae bacterium]
MPQFEREGARVHYEMRGSGTPLLLIAGTASDGASWSPLLPLLEPRFQLILIDNRGSGRTRSEGDITLMRMAADAAALLEHLGIARADVVGHSLGGHLGLLLAVEHPARVRRLITLGSGTMTAASRMLFRDMARLYFTAAPEDWFRLLYQWLFSERFFADEAGVAAAAAASASYAYRQSPADFARQVAAIERGARVDFRRVRCPVLAVAAERDLLAPPEAVAALHREVPDLRHLRIAEAAHSVHWEQPEAVAEAMIRFLEA